MTVKATTAPESVGRPVRAASEVAVVPVMVGIDPEDAVEPEPVIVTPVADTDAVVDPVLLAVPVAEAVFDTAPVFDADADFEADPVPVAPEAVERLGRLEAAEAAIARVTATAMDRCTSLIVYVKTREALKKRNSIDKVCARSRFVGVGRPLDFEEDGCRWS